MLSIEQEAKILSALHCICGAVKCAGMAWCPKEYYALPEHMRSVLHYEAAARYLNVHFQSVKKFGGGKKRALVLFLLLFDVAAFAQQQIRYGSGWEGSVSGPVTITLRTPGKDDILTEDQQRAELVPEAVYSKVIRSVVPLLMDPQWQGLPDPIQFTVYIQRIRTVALAPVRETIREVVVPVRLDHTQAVSFDAGTFLPGDRIFIEFHPGLIRRLSCEVYSRPTVDCGWRPDCEPRHYRCNGPTINNIETVISRLAF